MWWSAADISSQPLKKKTYCSIINKSGLQLGIITYWWLRSIPVRLFNLIKLHLLIKELLFQLLLPETELLHCVSEIHCRGHFHLQLLLQLSLVLHTLVTESTDLLISLQQCLEAICLSKMSQVMKTGTITHMNLLIRLFCFIFNELHSTTLQSRSKV